MSKYDPIGVFLSNQSRNHIPITFDEIERILGSRLPASKQYPAWWSNSTTNNVMTQQWLDAGYQTESVNVASEKLVFCKVSNVSTPSSSGGHSSPPPDQELKPRRHPLFGCMEGLITFPDDLDLTEPADPEWGENAFGEAK